MAVGVKVRIRRGLAVASALAVGSMFGCGGADDKGDSTANLASPSFPMDP
jgi:hypothetical protein